MDKLTRAGDFTIKAPIQKIFPLLCPKREEEWIPGWEAETIWSKSGYNEEGAVFKTLKPYGTELYWTTLRYDMDGRVVEFFITAAGLFIFRFIILLEPVSDKEFRLVFKQEFTPVSEAGDAHLRRLKADDFGARMKDLKKYMSEYLK